MLDYYTLEATLDKLSNDKHTYTKADLATLCRTKKLTPLFAYNLYGIEIEHYTFGNPSSIKHISGYLTNQKLLDLLDGLSDSISLIDATVIYDSNDPDNSYTDMFGYQVMLIDKPFSYSRYKTEDDYNPYNETKPFIVTKDNLRFKRDEVEALTNHKNKTSQHGADEGQGDTLLILGAVMECIKDIAKPNYTQQHLIDVIKEKYPHVDSLSQSTLTKKFPIAKKHLKQRVN